MGDEQDAHALNYHEHDPDCPGAGDELKETIKALQPLYKLFTSVEVCESNHGSMVWRRALTHGIPRAVFKSSREQIEAPQGWRWHEHIILKASSGEDIYFHHGKSATPGKLARNMGMCAVEAHFHSKFEIHYCATPNKLYWGAHVGSLCDDDSLAMAYGKRSMEKPIKGCLMIVGGYPILVPMLLKRDGRWTGRLVH
jgi:hypothetical protein